MKLRVLVLIAILLQGFLQVIGDENDNDEYDEVRKSAIKDANRPERPFGNVSQSSSPSPRYRLVIANDTQLKTQVKSEYLERIPRGIQTLLRSTSTSPRYERRIQTLLRSTSTSPRYKRGIQTLLGSASTLPRYKRGIQTLLGSASTLPRYKRGIQTLLGSASTLPRYKRGMQTLQGSASTLPRYKRGIQTLPGSTSTSPRYKRGFGSLIKFFAKVTAKVVKRVPKPLIKKTKQGLRLIPKAITHDKVDDALTIAELIHSAGNALSDGCMTYPDICTGLDKLKVIERQIKELQKAFEAFSNDDNLQQLSNIYHNNKLLRRRILKLVEDFDYLSTYHLDSNVDGPAQSLNRTPEEEFSYFEYSMITIKEHMENNKVSTLQYLGIEMATKFSISEISKSLSKNYEEEWQKFVDKKIYDKSDTIQEQDLDKMRSGKINDSMRKRYKIKSPKWKIALKAVRETVKNVGTSIIKFPSKVKHSFAYPKDTLDKLHFKILNKMDPFKSKRKFIKTIKNSFNRKLSKSKFILRGLGEAASGFSIYLVDKSYRELRDNVRSSLNEFVILKDNLTNELKFKEHNFSIFMQSAINNFTRIAETFKAFVYDKTETLYITEVFPPKSIPANIGHQLMQNYSLVSEQNIDNEQHKLLHLLNDPKYNLKTLKNWLLARYYMRKYIQRCINEKSSFQNMYRNFPLIFILASEDVKHFGLNITIVDLLCMMAMLQPKTDVYDFFNTSSLRENCTSDVDSLNINSVLSERLDILVRHKIEHFVNDENTAGDVSFIVENIANILKLDEYMVAPFNIVPTKQYLECKIADIYPDKLPRYFPNSHDFGRRCPDIKNTLISNSTFITQLPTKFHKNGKSHDNSDSKTKEISKRVETNFSKPDFTLREKMFYGKSYIHDRSVTRAPVTVALPQLPTTVYRTKHWNKHSNTEQSKASHFQCNTLISTTVMAIIYLIV